MSSAIETLRELGLLPVKVEDYVRYAGRTQFKDETLEALAAVAVEQAEKLRRLQNRDADAALLAVANARGTCGECYYNRKCSIQDAARAGDAFYCAAFEQKDEGPYDAPVSSDFLP